MCSPGTVVYQQIVATGKLNKRFKVERCTKTQIILMPFGKDTGIRIKLRKDFSTYDKWPTVYYRPSSEYLDNEWDRAVEVYRMETAWTTLLSGIRADVVHISKDDAQRMLRLIEELLGKKTNE